MRAWSVVRTLSPSRLWNAGKVYASFWYARRTKKPEQWGLPFALSIEPTTSCNLRCPECPSGLRSFSRPTGMLQREKFHELVDQFAPHLMYLNFYFQGEPYLNPNLLEMVHYAHRKKILTSTSTNAHYLDSDKARATVQSGLDRLIISIDGTTQETYQAYRIGGKLDKVLEGTRNILHWKKQLKSKTPHVVFQFLVTSYNEHQVKDVQLMAHELGVDEVHLKTAQVYDFENGNVLIPNNDKYARYTRNAEGRWVLKNQLEDHCWRMWHSCVITWDGGVVPCCFDKDAHHRLGQLNNFTLKDIWFSPRYRNFRMQVLNGREQIEICKNCSEGSLVYGE
jgi:radical SAM protein with 4Fe4S-binding SPASM domain